ncbi:MAG: dTDP-4-dehydrorhamnose reductase [Dehalococcoidia bacterium]|nr:dTDP-4-dehydrorhamnose reductase [Dehalococcoidia bacterium]
MLRPLLAAPSANMRILITGGRGQLGQALQAALGAHEVTALGHDELDVTDADAARRALAQARPEVVIHAAAWTDTADCERDPERALAVNAGGAGCVAEACAGAGAAMLYVSSNEVFDGEKGAPYEEDDEPRAVNEYGRSKLEGERLVRSALGRHWIVRTSWLYGPGRESFPEKIVQAAHDRGSLRLVTDETASPTWTVDLAEAIARLVREPRWGVYHLTNSGYCSRREWGQEVLRLAGLAHIPAEPATQAEYGGPYRKPVMSALANVRAARLGIVLRPWQEALCDHVRVRAQAVEKAESSR